MNRVYFRMIEKTIALICALFSGVCALKGQNDIAILAICWAIYLSVD